VTYKVKINNIFIIFISFGIFIFPALPIGSGDINIEQLILWLFIFTFFFKNKIKVEKKFLLLIAFIIFEAILIINSSHIEWLLHEANNVIPNKWHEMYGKREITNFYKPILQSLFQLVHITENFLVFFIAKNIYQKSDSHNNLLLNSLSCLLLFQLLVCFIQHFVLKIDRPYGSLDNTQNIGIIIFITIILISDRDNILLKILILILSLTLLYLSNTKSAYATFLILVILLYFKNIRFMKYLTYLTFTMNFTISVFFVILFKDAIISFFNIVFTNSFSLNLRFLMWSTSFLEIFNNSPFLGAYGRATEFPDSIIWYFLVSYGIIGLLIFIYFFHYLIKLNSIKVNLLIFIFFFQGFTYYGYMLNPVSYLWWFALGISYEETKFKNYLFNHGTLLHTRFKISNSE